MRKKVVIMVAAVVVGLPLAGVLAGQMNLLAGKPPADLGVRNGMLKPPGADAQNVVSSQAAMHPHRPDHVIAPLRISSDAATAFAKLERIVRGMEGASVVVSEPHYLRAAFRSKWLRFVDDVEFFLDPHEGVIHMRSASRLGRRDFGVNRARLEAVRTAFDAT
ncbi:MAG TPA: DUF1499 domain-containing protein [Noviherbaspirillum sp.]|jgi:uncharacterized protein (DUF1499 family)|uniref:DUF1499 domain-containing protein n=1 Tax=Noviherbaspirillum sp. TaxID=1926288 RepID=UPI002DDD956D|nr:DUF1499 domain-containing protein [Noviherbaspirillum sp.]HEV2609282.1 DUF1499 domain-containing protein [Noviherbaspirillum sp.]